MEELHGSVLSTGAGIPAADAREARVGWAPSVRAYCRGPGALRNRPAKPFRNPVFSIVLWSAPRLCLSQRSLTSCPGCYGADTPRRGVGRMSGAGRLRVGVNASIASLAQPTTGLSAPCCPQFAPGVSVNGRPDGIRWRRMSSVMDVMSALAAVGVACPPVVAVAALGEREHAVGARDVETDEIPREWAVRLPPCSSTVGSPTVGPYSRNWELRRRGMVWRDAVAGRVADPGIVWDPEVRSACPERLAARAMRSSHCPGRAGRGSSPRPGTARQG